MIAVNISLDEFASIFEQSILIEKKESAYFLLHNLLYEGEKIVLINTPSECFIIQ